MTKSNKVTRGSSCSTSCDDTSDVSQSQKEFMPIPGGFYCNGEKFILSVMKEGKEVAITEVIYDLCKAVSDIKSCKCNLNCNCDEHFTIESFVLSDEGLLTITGSDGVVKTVDFEPLFNRVKTLETKCTALDLRVVELETCVADLVKIN